MDPGGRPATGHSLPEPDLQTTATLQLQQPTQWCGAQTATEAVPLLPDANLHPEQDQLLHDGWRTDQAGSLLHHLPADLPGDLCVRQRVHQVHLLRSSSDQQTAGIFTSCANNLGKKQIGKKLLKQNV